MNAAAVPVTVSCGQTLTKSVTLTADLQCSGLVGLILGAPKVTLNLNGHSIYGPDISGSLGIQVRGTSDIVENGEVASGRPASMSLIRNPASDPRRPPS